MEMLLVPTTELTVNIQEADTVKLLVRIPDTLSYLCEFGEALVITN